MTNGAIVVHSPIEGSLVESYNLTISYTIQLDAQDAEGSRYLVYVADLQPSINGKQAVPSRCWN